jgi:hypothetical protein
MEIDVGRLLEMHPHLAGVTGADCVHKSAVGLARHGHRPGVTLDIAFDGRRERRALYWPADSGANGDQLDVHRVTEDTAEAIALALVNVVRGWVVRRRAQREECADWLLLDTNNHLIALEVAYGMDKKSYCPGSCLDGGA